MIKKITVKGNSVIVHISTKSKTELTFFDAVRKASAEFVNTPDGRKIYYKKGSFSY